MGLDMYLEKRIKGGDNSYPHEGLCYWGETLANFLLVQTYH